MNTKKKFLLIAFVSVYSLLALTLAGCNTADGLGKDIEKVGDEIQDGVN